VDLRVPNGLARSFSDIDAAVVPRRLEVAVQTRLHPAEVGKGTGTFILYEIIIVLVPFSPLLTGPVPADLAALIAAALPAPVDQKAAGLGPRPAEAPTWPWSAEVFRARLTEARALLAERPRGRPENVESLGEDRG
jgi:hypothetical protein